MRAIKAHPGVFIAGAVAYAVTIHFVLPRFAPNVKQKLPA